jgi:hypothetical protein
MRSGTKVTCFAAVLGFLITGISGFSYGAGPEISLRYAGDVVIGNHLTRGQEFFAKRVDEIANVVSLK